MKYASIDIGTNTILMLLAEVSEDGKIKIISEYHSIARLGEGVDKTGIINQNALQRATTILTKYKILIESNSIDQVKIVATSAMRDAKNASEIAEILKSVIGSDIHIINGHEEAKLSFLGTVDTDDKSLVIDIGGGSTEIIIGEGKQILDRISLQIGAVRLTEKFFHSQPLSKEMIDQSSAFIQSALSKFDLSNFSGKIYAVGGTATTITSSALCLKDYEDAKVHNYVLTYDQLIKTSQNYYNAAVDEIVNKYGVHPKRADLISSGAQILSEIILKLKKSSFIISAHGLRYGNLKQMINDNL